MRKVLIHAIVLKEKGNLTGGSTGLTSYVIEVMEENLNPEYLCTHAWELGMALTRFEIIEDDVSVDFGEDIVLGLDNNGKIIVTPSMANVEDVHELELLVTEMVNEMNSNPIIDLDNIKYLAKYDKFGSNAFIIEEYSIQLNQREAN